MSADEHYASEAEALADALPPYANTLPTGESTSAALRRVEQERDEALADADRCEDANIRHMEERDLARAELVSARTELDAVRKARDNLDQLLADARTEIADLDRQLKLCPRCGIELNADLSGGTPALTSWIVARDGGRNCQRCEQEIRRGEAYELMYGTDALQHIHCRDRTEEQ